MKTQKNTQNLEISQLSPRKTGINNDWEDKDYLHVSLQLKPTSNKFKFIKEAGFDKHGNGRNQSKLQERAQKLSEAIKTGTGLDSVSVNEFSFEIKEGHDTSKKTILVVFWVK